MLSTPGITKKSYVEFLRAAGCALTLLAASPSVSAADYQWDANGATAGLGGGGTYNPTSSAGWDLLGTGLDNGTDVTVASNNAADSYYFGGLSGTGTAAAINNGGGYGFAGFVYFTVGGYTLTDTTANGDISFAKLVTVGGTGTTTFAASGAGVGDFKFNAGLTVSSGATARIGVRANSSGAISSVAFLTGAGNVEFYGSNAHQLSGANTTFTGTAKLESATLRLMNLSSLAGATLNYVGGALSFNAGTGTYNLGGLTGTSGITLNGNSLSVGAKNVDTSFSGTLLIGTGGGGLAKVGTGVLTLSNAGNTYSGGTTLTEGILNFSSGALSNTGNVTLNGGTLQWASGNTQDLSARFVMVNAKTAMLDTGANEVTLATGFGSSTTGALTKIGSGVLTLSGTSTYTGATTVTSGRLNLTGVLASAIALNGGTLSGTGSTTGLLTTAAGTSIGLVGGATTTSITTNGVTFAGATSIDFVNAPNTGTIYDVITYGSGSVTNLENLSSVIRGTLSSSGSKITFTTPDAFLTRTWNTTSGTWNIGSSTNFAESDQKFYNTDNVVFGALAVDSTITLSGSLKPTTVTVSNSTNVYTFAGTAGSSEIAAFSSLVKNNAGTLILTSAHSYTGGTTVNGGILQLGAGGVGAGFATNGSYTINSGGTLRIYQGSGAGVAPTWASIAGAGILALNKDGSGSTNKDWGNAALGVGFTGTLKIEEGRVYTANGASLGGATGVVVEDGAQLGTWSGGTFTPNLTIAGTGWGESGYEVAIRGANGGLTSTFSGGIALAASAAIGAAPTAFLQVDGVVSGASGSALTVGTTSLTGTVTLTGNNTYTGNTNIVAGTLKIGSAGKLGTGSYSGNISNAATLLFSSSANQTLSGVISGAGAVTKDTSSSSILTLSGTNTYSGVTTVSAGTLEITGSSSGASKFIISGTVANNSVLNINASAGAINTLSGAASFIVANTANSTGTVNMAGGTLTSNHELWLGEASATANGKFYLTGGTVEVKNWTAIGRSGVGLLEISGGLWKNTTAGNFAIGTGTGGNNSGVVTVKGTGTLEVIGRTLAIRESFGVNSQGTLNLSESGVVKATTIDFGLSGASSVGTGTLNVSGGNLWVNTISKTGANTTATINLSGGTLGALDNNATWAVGMALTSGTTTLAARDFAGVARTITLSGVVSGAGSLTKTGNGTLTLSGTNTLTGNVTADTGTLTISGTHQSATSINANNGSTVNFSINNFFTASHSTAAANSRSITASNGGNLVFSSTTEARLGNIQLSGGNFTSNRGISGFDILLADVSTGAATVSVTGSTASTMNGTGGLHLLGLQNFDVADVTSSSAADLVVSLQLANSGTQGANTAGGINKLGLGTMSLTNVSNNFSGGANINAGTLAFANGTLGSAGNVSVNGGTLQWSAGNTENLSARLSGGASGATLDTNGNTVSLDSGMSFAGNLTKVGAGTLNLSGANTVAGTTAVNAGKVNLTHANGIGASSVSLGAAGSLGLSFALGADTTFTNTFAGTGLVDIATSGGYALTLSGLSGFAGTIQLTNGIFDATTSGWTGNLTFAGGALAGGLSGYTGQITVSAGTTISASSGLPANVVLASGGTIDFTGVNSAATITYAGGALSNAGGFTGNVVVSGTGVEIGAGALGGGTLVVAAGSSVNVTGTNSNRVLAAGGLILGGANLTGTVVASSGSFKLGASAGQAGIDALNTISASALEIAGATVDLSNSFTSANITYNSGTIQGAANYTGTLTVANLATLSMNGTIGGTVEVATGATLSGNGTFNSANVSDGAVLSPGNSPGIQTYNGTLALSGGSTWVQQIFNQQETLSVINANGDTVTGRGYDTIRVTTGDGSGIGILDLTDVTALNKITLKLMTLTNWVDSVGGTPTELNLPLAYAVDEFGVSIPKQFVIAAATTVTFAPELYFASGDEITSLFAFDTTDYYFADGTTANSGNFRVFFSYNALDSINEITLRVVPEPSTYGILLGGLALAVAAIRRRRQMKA